MIRLIDIEKYISDGEKVHSDTRMVECTQSFPRKRLYEVSKRTLDVLSSCFSLIILLPVLIVIAAAISLSSPGPVFFRQRRLGRWGKEFWCYKFRTMVVDSEEILNQRPDLREEFLKSYKLKNDPRVTRIGAFLRKTSLDELPQLINVLKGDMSLIGPRPIVQSELEKYGNRAEELLSVKPGLGGVWQVYGRSDTSYIERVKLDMVYVELRSMRLDIQLLVLTAIAVLRKKGAY